MGADMSAPADGYHVGVTGHRLLSHPTTIARAVHDALAEIKAAHASVIAWSALAIGADTVFAEAALDLLIPLGVVTPFAEYLEDFPQPDDRLRYSRLLASAAMVVQLPYSHRSDQAYRAAGVWIVERCQLLVAIWDGQPSTDIGGTADVVAFAEEIGRPITKIYARRGAESGVSR